MVREFVAFTPPGECVVAGHDISGELAELCRFAGLLAAAGGVVLAWCWRGAGWWVVGGRAGHPADCRHQRHGGENFLGRFVAAHFHGGSRE